MILSRTSNRPPQQYVTRAFLDPAIVSTCFCALSCDVDIIMVLTRTSVFPRAAFARQPLQRHGIRELPPTLSGWVRGVQSGTRVPNLNMELMIDNVVDVLC